MLQQHNQSWSPQAAKCLTKAQQRYCENHGIQALWQELSRCRPSQYTGTPSHHHGSDFDTVCCIDWNGTRCRLVGLTECVSVYALRYVSKTLFRPEQCVMRLSMLVCIVQVRICDRKWRACCDGSSCFQGAGVCGGRYLSWGTVASVGTCAETICAVFQAHLMLCGQLNSDLGCGTMTWCSILPFCQSDPSSDSVLEVCKSQWNTGGQKRFH